MMKSLWHFFRQPSPREQPTTDSGPNRFATDNRPLTTNNPRMTDPRCKKLAKLLIEYSTDLKKGDRVLLDMIDVPDEFSIDLMRAVRAAGVLPLIEVRHTRITR